jgi:hypothetical protein
LNAGIGAFYLAGLGSAAGAEADMAAAKAMEANIADRWAK